MQMIRLSAAVDYGSSGALCFIPLLERGWVLVRAACLVRKGKIHLNLATSHHSTNHFHTAFLCHRDSSSNAPYLLGGGNITEETAYPFPLDAVSNGENFNRTMHTHTLVSQIQSRQRRTTGMSRDCRFSVSKFDFSISSWNPAKHFAHGERVEGRRCGFD